MQISSGARTTRGESAALCNPGPRKLAELVAQAQPLAVPRAPQPSGEDLLGSYVGRCIRNTLLSFTAPTAVSALLPPPVRWVAIPTAGVIFTHLRQQPAALAFDPQPNRTERLTAVGIGFGTFIPAFGLQAYATQRAGVPGSGMATLAQGVDKAFKRFCKTLPGPVGQALLKYPANFVLARATAQIGATATGALLAHAYLRQVTGGDLAVRARDDKENSKAFNPMAYLVGAAFFAVPAMMSTPKFTSHLARLGVTGPPMVVAATLVAAGLATDDYIVSNRTDGEPRITVLPDDKVGKR